jgi:hypothetical protein
MPSVSGSLVDQGVSEANRYGGPTHGMRWSREWQMHLIGQL